MAIKILKTSAKHYHEKKHLPFAPKPTVQRIYILEYPCAKPGGLLDLFGTDVKCKNNFWWRINRFKNINELPIGYVEFISEHVLNKRNNKECAYYNIDVKTKEGFNVMRRYFINSVLNN